MTVKAIVIGALGMVPKGLEGGLEDFRNGGKAEISQTTALSLQFKMV